MAAIPLALPRGATLTRHLGRWGGPGLAVVAAFALAFKPSLGLWSAGAPWVLDIYQGVSIGTGDLALVLLVVCGWRGRALTPPARALAVAGGVLLLCLAISATVAESPPLALAALVRCAAGLLAALAIVRRPELVPWLLIGGLGALVVQVPFATLQLVTQSTFPTGFLFDGWPQELTAATSGAAVIIGPDGNRWQRVLGTFPHPNILGGCVAVALVLATPRLLRGERIDWQAVALWSLGWLLLLVTFSRAALLAALLGCALHLIGRPALRRRLLGTVVGMPVASLAFTALVFGPALTERLAIVRAIVASPAFQQRDLIAGIAWAFIRQDPWRGVGAGNFTLAELRPGFDAISVEPVHAVPLLVAAEAGVLAGLAWVALLVAPLAVEWYRARRISPARLAIPVALLTLALLDHYLWTFGSGRALFWLALGVWVAGYGSASSTSDDQSAGVSLR
jgi:hypothetical protein